MLKMIHCVGFLLHCTQAKRSGRCITVLNVTAASREYSYSIVGWTIEYARMSTLRQEVMRAHV